MPPINSFTTFKPRCPHCRGTGYDTDTLVDGTLIAEPCEHCNGSGSISGITLCVAAYRDTAAPHFQA